MYALKVSVDDLMASSTGTVVFQSCDASATIPQDDGYRKDFGAYPLTILKREGDRSEDKVAEINIFSACCKMMPPANKYLEFVPLPSLLNHGYFMPSAPLLITPGEEILIPLYKFRDGSDLKLPMVVGHVFLRDSKPFYFHQDKPVRQAQQNQQARVNVPVFGGRQQIAQSQFL
jgi:hypothetical protein